jgi:nucleoside-diphosphate-sugar epimerase
MGEIELGWKTGIDMRIARIFDIYGPNEPLGEKIHVIGDLISKVIHHSGGDFIVRGDGKQSRDFLFISDCVDALIKLEEKTSSSLITVNIGSGQPTEIGALACKLVDISGKNINLFFNPIKPASSVSRAADISRAKCLFS